MTKRHADDDIMLIHETIHDNSEQLLRQLESKYDQKAMYSINDDGN